MSDLKDGARPCSDDGERWFAVFTLPNKEVQARVELENQRFRVFLPQRLQTVRHARRVTTRLSPVFPRYLFVRLDLRRMRWRSINGTRGVASLVSFGDAPTPIPAGVVEALMAACDERCVIRYSDRLRPGQAVQLGAGPFAELIGTIDRLDGPDAARVLLDIMGRRVQVRARRDLALPAA